MLTDTIGDFLYAVFSCGDISCSHGIITKPVPIYLMEIEKLIARCMFTTSCYQRGHQI